jgi:predicted secreted protein
VDCGLKERKIIMSKLGLNAKIYYGTAGTKPTETMLDVVDDSVTLNFKREEVQVPLRQLHKLFKAGQIEASADFKIDGDTDNAGFQALRTAFIAGSLIALFISDEAAATGEGLDGDFIITDFSRDEPTNGIITYSVSAKPGADATRDPNWVIPA